MGTYDPYEYRNNVRDSYTLNQKRLDTEPRTEAPRKEAKCCFIFNAKLGVQIILVFSCLFALVMSIQHWQMDMTNLSYFKLALVALCWIVPFFGAIGIYVPNGHCLIIWWGTMLISIILEIEPWRQLNIRDTIGKRTLEFGMVVMIFFFLYVINCYRRSVI